eukprot:5101344-Amphidinium_carterae.1
MVTSVALALAGVLHGKDSALTSASLKIDINNPGLRIATKTGTSGIENCTPPTHTKVPKFPNQA